MKMVAIRVLFAAEYFSDHEIRPRGDFFDILDLNPGESKLGS